MSRFFVGQRVRVIAVAVKQWEFAIGMETRILGEEGDFWNLDLPAPPGFRAFVGKSEAGKFLSPILDSGQQPCDEEFKRDLDKLLEGVPA